MTPMKSKLSILYSILGFIFIAIFIYSTHSKDVLIKSFLTAKSIKSPIDSKIDKKGVHWDGTLVLNSNTSIRICTTSMPTHLQGIQYSDESNLRLLTYGDAVAYTLEDIRIDDTSRWLYIRVSGYRNKPTGEDTYLYKFDLVQRKIVAHTHVSPEPLPPPLKPWSEPA